MRWILGLGMVWGVLALVGFTLAQPPGSGQGNFGNQGGGKGGPGKGAPGKGGPGKEFPGKGGPGGGRTTSVEEMVNRLMAFDKNQDGVLTKDELGDGRLHPLFEKANTSKNGKLSKTELTAYLTKENARLGANAGGPMGSGKGPGGREGKKGGRGGFGKDKGNFEGKKGGEGKGPPPEGDRKGPPPASR